MGNYTIFQMFENPRRGRQARNFLNKCSENSRSQIILRTDIFRKLSLGTPDNRHEVYQVNCSAVYQRKALASAINFISNELCCSLTIFKIFKINIALQ